jgi:predicted AlkP superfamily phosphohydrolase/phosphomutase
MKKTLLIGLDAACWEYLEPLLASGRMPTLNSLMEKGAWGTINSTMPPWTPTAWSSIITGKNPGKHGIYDMICRRPGTYEFTLTNSTLRKGTPFWKYLNRQGIQVGLVNVPFTYPVDEIQGFTVCGFGTPNSVDDFAYPKEALRWVRTKYPDFKPEVDPVFLHKAPPDKILEAEIGHQACNVDIAISLAEQYGVEVLAINLMLTDHANHKMPTLEQVQGAYQKSDSDLSKLIEGFKPDHILLISDHGSSRLKGDFLLNAWLQDAGYYNQLENESQERKVALNWIIMQWLRKSQGWNGVSEKVARTLIREISLKSPSSIQERIYGRFNEVIPFAREHVLMSNQPDFSRSTVFPGSVYSGLLYLNVSGREPDGIVPHSKIGDVLAGLSGKLMEIEEPETGEPLFPQIYLSEDVYWGSAMEGAPDLILDSYSSSWNIRMRKHIPVPEKARGRYFVDVANRRDFGWHSRDGIFIFVGEGFQPGPVKTHVQLMDISATLFQLYGVPIPEDYDGRVLSDLFTTGMPPGEIKTQVGDEGDNGRVSEDLTAQEAAELASHLRALGYLD